MLIHALDLDPDGAGRHKIAHPVGPFDDDHSALLQQFFEANPLKILRPTDAISIEMKHSQPTAIVYIQQDISRAADGARVAADAAQEAADELGLAGAKFAFEGDAFAAVKTLRQRDRQSLSLIRTV